MKVAATKGVAHEQLSAGRGPLGLTDAEATRRVKDGPLGYYAENYLLPLFRTYGFLDLVIPADER